jgi:DNA topoisomerase 2-associated protein PAT1
LRIGVHSIDFEDTYDGLGDRLDDDQDAFNEDTFGDVGTGSVGKDFDFFGQTAQVADAIGEEQVRFNLQHPGAPSGSSAKEIAAQPPATSVSADKPKRTGYEKYQDPGYIPDLQAKSSVWGLQKKPEPAHEPVHEHVHQHVHQHVHEPVSQARKMLSLEEVEAQLRSHGIAPVQPPVSMPMPMPDLSHLQRTQQLPNVPEAFSQLPPEFLQAQFPKDVPPAHLLHHPSMVPEPYSLPPSAPNVPLHLLQNANILPQHMAPPQRQAIPPRVQQPPPQHPPPQAIKVDGGTTHGVFDGGCEAGKAQSQDIPPVKG